MQQDEAAHEAVAARVDAVHDLRALRGESVPTPAGSSKPMPPARSNLTKAALAGAFII